MSVDVAAPGADVGAGVTDTGRGPHVLAWLVAGSAIGLPLLGIAWWAATPAAAREPLLATPLLIIGLTFGLVGALLLARLPANAIGRLLAVIGVCGGLNIAAQSYSPFAAEGPFAPLPGVVVAAWFAGWIWVPSFVLFGTLLLQLFPDGRPLSSRWRGLTVWTLVLTVAMTAIAALAAAPVGDLSPYPNPFAVLPFDLDAAGAVLFPLWTGTTLASIVALVLRHRRGDADGRRQTGCFGAVAIGAVLVMLAGEPVLGDAFWWVNTLMGGAVPIVMAVAILRGRLFADQFLVDRALVFALLLVGLAVAYALTAGLLAAVAGSYGPGHAFAGGVVVALVFHPLRTRIQRQVDRLLYGERAEPYALVREVAVRLQGATGPREALEGLADALSRGLRLRGVAVVVCDGERALLRASTGVVDDTAVPIGLSWQGERVGHLQVMPRSNTVTLEPVDERLLGELADHVAVVVYAVRLAADLQHSRERLVTALEDERRRLRRDLHDGLGPALSGIVMALDTARHVLSADPERTHPVLIGIRDEVQQAITDIRGLVYGLRPPALDELGLVGALQAGEIGADPHHSDAVRVTFDVKDCVADLPAAVEVAAFRIVQEALTNVRRHAQASHVLVRITRTDVLEIEVSDDGTGIAPTAPSGVGMASMRERAAEIGGTCATLPAADGGTRVQARLPLQRLG